MNSLHSSLFGLGRFDVYVSEHLPQEKIGTLIYWAHPLVQWLAKHTRIRPYTIGGPIHREQAFIQGKTMFLSPAMYQAFRDGAAGIVNMADVA